MTGMGGRLRVVRYINIKQQRLFASTYCKIIMWLTSVYLCAGLTWKDALEQCPPGVVPACHNSKDTITVSGPKDAVSKFVSDLKQKQVFAKKVDSAGVAFHSSDMKTVAPAMKAALDQVMISLFKVKGV